MFTNYIKTAIRNFARHKSSFFINVSGLSIGLACSVLILLWVLDEVNINRFHDDLDRIYQVMEHQVYANGNIFTTQATPGLLAPALVEEIPEIEYAATLSWSIQYLFSEDDHSIKTGGIYARPDIFRILTFDILAGNPEHWLKETNSVVISDELAEKLFGDRPALDRTVTVDGSTQYRIAGVFKKFPATSTLQFDFILPFKVFENNNAWTTSWASNGPRTLAKLRKGADPAAVDDKIKDFIKERNEGSVVDLFLYPYADLYLYGRFEEGRAAGGRIEYVRLFSIVALFILLIACVNFMNLSTAQSAMRAREVGIRKSIGAGRGSLIGRYLGEAILISFCALILGLILVELLLPAFNSLTGKEITLRILNPAMILILAGIGLITGVVAGSYPAFYLSAFDPVRTLKGEIRSSTREVFTRKGLVVFQFTLSIVLIVSTILIHRQVQFLQTKHIGYKKENLIYFPIEGALHANWESFRREVSALPEISGISRANHHFLGRSSNTSSISWPGKNPDSPVLFESMMVDFDLIETLGFEIHGGRSFSREFGADSARIIINETAARIMEMDDPVGRSVTIWRNELEIAGVLKDFNYDHLRSRVEPLFMMLDRQNNWMHAGYIRVQTDDIKSTLQRIQLIHESVNPAYPFDYSFVDDRYANLYRSEMRIGKLSNYFAVFAIFISSLGLFGLSAFTAERRKKEMSIRKVLGATVTGLVGLHAKEFLRLILLAAVISGPVSYYIMHTWLQEFVHRIEISLWVFVAAGGLAVAIAVITVSYQAIKTALSNPVDHLKYE